MNGPTAEQWRQAAYELRQHAMKFDDLADEAEATAKADIEAEQRHVIPLTELPASIEQLVATYNAVHSDDSLAGAPTAVRLTFNYLRGVKP